MRGAVGHNARCHCGAPAVWAAIVADRDEGRVVAVLLCDACLTGEGWRDAAKGVYVLAEPTLREPDPDSVTYGWPVGEWCQQGRLAKR